MTRRGSSIARWGMAATLAAALAACGRDAVVSAGRTEATREDWRLFQARRAASADVDKGLEELSSRVLLAEAGRRAGLAKQPEVRARIAAAERELLAQAYLDQELAQADREDGLRRRYELEKEKLARRRIHVAHVAFRVKEGDAGSRAAAQSRATRAYARLAGGERFEKVAEDLSDDPVTAGKGGDLGPLREGEVDPGFFEAAAALAAGEVSKPFESPFGFHLVKALEAPGTETPPFEAVRGRLAAEARREASAALLARLREDIGVTVHRDRAVSAAVVASKPGADR